MLKKEVILELQAPVIIRLILWPKTHLNKHIKHQVTSMLN